MTDLHTRVQQLDRPTAYEAAQLLAAELGAEEDRPIDHEIVADPLTHQGDLEDLAKVLLLTTVDIDPGAVERAIDGAGHKQIVLGGGELILLAYLVVNGIQLIMSRGKKSEHVETVVIERDSNGRERVIIKRMDTQYGISGSAASLLRQLPTDDSQAPPDSI
ncbi:hypothetical protein OHT20_32510 [Streptomyces caniferus]|uniref:hypothetical protein n=1 Tax=Streptomyces caniferus TaxID=285557 RepID=UPI002E2A27A0|nr:hypothetical protein [Streptomyces caniferus]